jgi:hypothetical protein
MGMGLLITAGAKTLTWRRRRHEGNPGATVRTVDRTEVVRKPRNPAF